MNGVEQGPVSSRDVLLDNLVAALRGVDPVVAVWVDGSLARGVGDEYSDLDLGVAVDDESLDDVIDALPGLVAGACDAVLLQCRGRLLNVVTTDWQRADIVVRTRTEVVTGLPGPVVIVHDPESLIRVVGQIEPLAVSARLPVLIEEFFRFVGLLPIVARRDEWVGALTATGAMTGMLVELMQLENGTLRTVGGALRVSERLTDGQRDELASLPPLKPDMQSVASVHIALARLFIPKARRLAAANEVAYPQPLEDAVAQHLRRHGIELGMDWF